MQCTKQHLYNQTMVYYGDIKLQSYKMSLPQVYVMSDWAPEKVLLYALYWQKALKLTSFWVGRYEKA